MKIYAILILGLLAGRSLGSNCTGSNGTTDFTVLISEFVEAMNEVPVPTVENGDIATVVQFRDAFVNASGALGLSTLHNLLNRTQVITDDLIDAIKKNSSELQRSIELTKRNNRKDNCLDDDLKRLTNQVQVFLNLNPGNVVIEPPTLPELPPQQVTVVSRTEDRSPSDMFLNFGELANGDLLDFYGFSQTLSMVGWRNTRNVSSITQAQLRDQFLNGPIMTAYRKAVDKVCEEGYFIRKHVSPETWKKFEEVGDRVIKISNDYKSSKNNDNC